MVTNFSIKLTIHNGIYVGHRRHIEQIQSVRKGIEHPALLVTIVGMVIRGNIRKGRKWIVDVGGGIVDIFFTLLIQYTPNCVTQCN